MRLSARTSRLDPADARYNGHLVTPDGLVNSGQATRFQPRHGTAQRSSVFINGMMTDHHMTTDYCQQLADTGRQVLGVHNATAGFWSDLSESVVDNLLPSLSHNAAVTTVYELLRQALNAKDETTEFIGHSQGAIILRAAAKQLEASMLRAQMPPEQVAAQLGTLNLITLGGAAGFKFPNGCRVKHHVNLEDDTTRLGARLPWIRRTEVVETDRWVDTTARWDTTLPLGEALARFNEARAHGVAGYFRMLADRDVAS